MIGTAVVAVVFAAPAGAVPTASFTASRLKTQVNRPVTFNASKTICDVTPCRYQWRWYRPTTAAGTDRIGTTMGEGVVLTYSWPTNGTKIVVLKVINATTSHGSSTAQQSIKIVLPPK